MAAQLPGILHSLAPVLDRYGYAAVVALAGHLAGDHIGAIYGAVQRYQKYLLAAVAVVVVLLARWARRRRSPNIGSSTCQRSNASNSRCWRPA